MQSPAHLEGSVLEELLEVLPSPPRLQLGAVLPHQNQTLGAVPQALHPLHSKLPRMNRPPPVRKRGRRCTSQRTVPTHA